VLRYSCTNSSTLRSGARNSNKLHYPGVIPSVNLDYGF